MRRTGLVLLVMLLLVVVASDGALAEGRVLKDEFKGDNGDPPKKANWRTEVGPGGSVELHNGTLEVSGTSHVLTRHGFHSEGFNVTLSFSPQNLSGEPLHVVMESEDLKEDKVRTFISVSWGGDHGWTVKWKQGKNERTHTDDEHPLQEGVWYELKVWVHEEEFNVTATVKSNMTVVFHHEGKVKAFAYENLVELGAVDSVVRYDDVRIYDTMERWQEQPVTSVAIGLFVIFFIVLLGPFLVKKIEHNLEAFLFAMGVAAVTLDTLLMDVEAPAMGEAGGHGMPPTWSLPLLVAGLKDPIMITLAVLFAGLVFHYFRDKFADAMEKALLKIELKIFVFIVVVLLGLVASIITAIIAALLLVEIITVLRLDRKTETDLTVLACFSIGLGAALTPVGEPLSTIIIITKLNEEFLYLFKLLGVYIIPSIFVIGIVGMYYCTRSHVSRDTLSEEASEEHIKEVPIRAFKVYLFVMALVFLGSGFAPIIEWYIIKLGPEVLFWVNMSSAILDNATLASAEIVPTMDTLQIKAATMALLISGGMLIPGNIPNIIAANKLSITSKEWARFGVPFGLFWMAFFFVLLLVVRL